MALLRIVHYPEPVLLKVGKPVMPEEFNDDLAQLVNDMFETMYDARGVGLAAPQIDVSKRLFVMDCGDGDPNPIARFQDVLGNPQEIDVTDLSARCVLHETDHCDGIVFLDRMTSLKRELAKRKIRKLQKTGKWD